jgi:hypothetical protein
MRATCTGIALLGAFLVLASAGCGGGRSAPPPITPDFTVSIQPPTVQVTAGESTTFTVVVTGTNGFTSPVALTFGLAPAGTTVSPVTFTVTPGGQQAVTISTAFWTVPGSTHLTLSGVTGAREHDVAISLEVGQPPFDAHSPGRTRFLRTDTVAADNCAVYDSATKRFFLTDPAASALIVFDAVKETEIARLTIPRALNLDLSPDHGILWVGTRLGDLYKVDPAGLKILERIPSREIGPGGQPAYQPLVLADGRLALLGGAIGPDAINGYSQIGIWDPRTNELQSYVTRYATAFGSAGTPLCSDVYIAPTFSLSADRRKVFVPDRTGAYLCELDPAAGTFREVTLDQGRADIILPTPDGRSLVLGSAAHGAAVYDAATLTLKSAFTPASGEFYNYLLTYDGSGLYLFNWSDARAYLYDYDTWQPKGWFPSFTVAGHLPSSVPPMAVDETGLVFGRLGYGVAFVDASALKSGAAPAPGTAWSVDPPSGPLTGGTSVAVRADPASDFAVASIYFGNRPGSYLSTDSLHINATSPRGGAGPADVTLVSRSGSMLVVPEGFSYGPHIYQVLSAHATAEGGTTGTIFGYGFAPSVAGLPADLHVLVGGQLATVTSFMPHVYNGDEWPLQQVDFTVPAGTAGTAADLTVSNSAGSMTARGALTYLPAVRSYPHPGSSFMQGVYDKRRDVYYFTDINAVQVFSAARGQWLDPLMTTSDPASSLHGVSISPDASKLAVSDAGSPRIYLVDLATGAVRSFTPPNDTPFQKDEQHPAGLAVTDNGVVYFVTYYITSSGRSVLRKLDPATGTFTSYVSGVRFTPSVPGYDFPDRVLLSADGARLYVDNWHLTTIDTATDQISWSPVIDQIDRDMALSGDSTRLLAGFRLTSASLDLDAQLVAPERWRDIVEWLYGIKLSPDGSLVFMPESHAIGVFDGRVGTPRGRVALPITLAPCYDSLVANGRDNLLVAITGDNADGVAVIDLNGIPAPPPLPYATSSGPLSKGMLQTAESAPAGTNPAQPAAGALEGTRRQPEASAFRRAPRIDPRLLRARRIK